MSVAVPQVLRHAVRDEPAGPAWLASIPELVARAQRRWDLVVHDPFETGMAAWTAPAVTTAGLDVVLKLSFPHEEARDEAAALAAWHGSGAVALVDADAGDQALLLRRVRPGTSLRDAALATVEHLAIGAEVLRRTASVGVPPGAPFQDLVQVASGEAATAAERIDRLIPSSPYSVDVGLARHAVELLRSLPVDAPQVGLLHGDLNPGNILRDSSAPSGDGWLAIDPKPVHGDLAYDPWPLLTQVGDWVDTTAAADELVERTRRVADHTGLDASRIASWCTARSLASGLWAADRGWWTGFRGADGDLRRATAWSRAAHVLGA